MGYYLSEGSVTRHKSKNGYKRNQISISQQKYIDKFYDDLSVLQFNLFKCKTNIIFNDRELADYLEQFGKSHEKFVPDVIMNMSPKNISIFLDAYCLGDGNVKKGKKWKGGNFRDSRTMFTSSDRMASQLGELIIKCGKSVSYKIDKVKGKKHKFKNGIYTINHNVWRVNELHSEFLWKFKKEIENYNGKVWCVELPKFHTLLVRGGENGKAVWCGNCQCVVIAVPPK